MKKKFVALTVVLIAALVGGVFAATSTMWTYDKSFTVVSGAAAVQYSLLQNLPDTLNLNTEYPLQVRCTNTAAIPYLVQAYLKVVGPAGFDNNDIFVRWSTYNDTAGAWIYFAPGVTEFGIGHAPAGFTFLAPDFVNHDGYWIDWTGSWSQINAGDMLTQYVYITILGSAPTGSYSASIVVNGQGV